MYWTTIVAIRQRGGMLGPELAVRISAIAASMGVTAVEPGTIELLCEAAHERATRTLEAGGRAAAHANRAVPNLIDLRVGATALRQRAPTPLSTLATSEAARERNQTPLPRLRPGVHLPQDAVLSSTPRAPLSPMIPSSPDRLSFGSTPWR